MKDIKISYIPFIPKGIYERLKSDPVAIADDTNGQPFNSKTLFT